MFLTRDQIEEVEIDLTGCCNLKCPLCTRNYQHVQHMLITNIRPLSDIKKQLDLYPNLRRMFLAGAISEPTLHPEFFEFIKYLNSRNIYFELFTNGSTHTTDWWKQLGELVPVNCFTAFTICGSTQELHAKYRVNSSLDQILQNAAAYRLNNKYNDYCQYIIFEYNQEDFKSQTTQDIIKQFAGLIKVESEGIRRLDNKVITPEFDVMPPKKRDKIIRYIFSQRPPLGTDIDIQCKSLKEHKIYIDQFGKVSACYIHAEFEQDYFNEESNKFDYTDICNYKYPDCYSCSKYVNNMIKRFNLEFIC